MPWKTDNNSWNGSSWNRNRRSDSDHRIGSCSSVSWQNSGGSSAWQSNEDWNNQSKDDWKNHKWNKQEVPGGSQEPERVANTKTALRARQSGSTDGKHEKKEDLTYGCSSGSNVGALCSSSSSSSYLPKVLETVQCKRCKFDNMCEVCFLPHTCSDLVWEARNYRIVQLQQSLAQYRFENEKQKKVFLQMVDAIVEVMRAAEDGRASREKVQEHLERCGVHELDQKDWVSHVTYHSELSKAIGIDASWVWLKVATTTATTIAPVSKFSHGPSQAECLISSEEEEPWPDFEDDGSGLDHTRLETVHHGLDSSTIIDQPIEMSTAKIIDQPIETSTCQSADAQQVQGIVCRKPQQVRCECPLCRLRDMDPFSPLGDLGDHGVLAKCVVSRGVPDAKLVFTKLKDEWHDNDKVEIRSVALEPQPQPDGWQFLGPRWPPQLTGIVKGKTVFEVPKKKIGHTRRENIYDVTKNVSDGLNTFELQIEWGTAENQSDFMIAAVLAQPLSDEDICIQNCLDFDISAQFGFDPDPEWNWGKPVLSKECGIERASRIVKELEQGDDEAEVLQSTSIMPARELRLKCPISQVLIETPVVGKQCRHLQCFDLMAYLATTRKQAKLEARWQCPICARRTWPADLALDHLAHYILQDEVWVSRGERFADKDDIVHFNSDGSWKRLQVAVGKVEDDSGGEDALDIDSSDESSQDVRMALGKKGTNDDGNATNKRKGSELIDVGESKTAKAHSSSTSKEAEEGRQLSENKRRRRNKK